MRRAFIALGIIIFLVYCWASVVYQNRVAVPDYKLVEVDLLDGMTREKWNESQEAQLTYLMNLENKNYQLPVDAKVKAPGSLDADPKFLSPDVPLTSDNFADFIKAAPPGQPVLMRLRDTSAIYGLLAHKYLLRDTIADPANPDGKPLYMGGVPLDKPMLDDLRAKGVTHFTVSGHAAPVNFQVGTSLMIALIFFILVAALKPVLWDPFIVMLEKRRKELEMGAEADRQNQVESIRFQDEKRRRNDELARNLQAERLGNERETAKEAAAIIKEARDREKTAKVAGLRQISDDAGVTHATLGKQIPELARKIADALTPGLGKGKGGDGKAG